MNVLIVCKKSTYEFYQGSQDLGTKTYVESDAPNARELLHSHREQRLTLDSIMRDLQQLGITYKQLYRVHLAEEDLSKYNLIISVGGDGTLLEVSHYLPRGEVSILGVNSDPQRSYGFFCCADRDNFRSIMENYEQQPKTQVSRLQVLRDGLPLPALALNDVLFTHSNPAANTRFVLECAGAQQAYRNSCGVVACTPAGSSAMMHHLKGRLMNLDEQEMQYKIRDNHAEHDKFGFAKEIKIISQTREGKVFIDGEHLSYDFGLGSVLGIKCGGTPITIVGDLGKKRKKS